MIKLYGIKTCDTCRKARRWLDKAGIDYCYIDLRENGIDAQRIQGWLDTHGGAKLINKRSRTWRELDGEARTACESDTRDCLLKYLTLIKRPILETSLTSLVGFSAARYEAALAGAD